MSVIQMEILDYIENSSYDENVKKFLKWAVIDAIKHPNRKHYTQIYEDHMDKILRG